MSDDPMYHAGMRRLQDARETRPLADRLERVTAHAAFTSEDRAFIERCSMMFVATADARGHPDCSYKGGLPGFVRVVDERTLAVPDYDGNGMYRSWGNVLVNPHVGLLFVDFESPRRIRVNGTAEVIENDPLLRACPGSVHIVRITATRIFPNCPRYIHRMQLVEYSAYAPRPEYAPPVPEWKKFDVYRDVLPARDKPSERGGIKAGREAAGLGQGPPGHAAERPSGARLNTCRETGSSKEGADGNEEPST